MEGAGIAVLIVVVFVAGIGLWVLSMALDKDRIRDYIQQRGGRVVSISWAPFGKGWFGEKEERIYEVVYYDKDGLQHFATAKTSFWTGVYWTDDRVTHSKPSWYDSLPPSNEPRNPLIDRIPKQAAEDEAEELRRLREENAQLREQLSNARSTEVSAEPPKCPACGAAITANAARCPSCQITLQ
jgi:predicted Zn-ribbon and HTH transcriptional regulator